MGQQMIQQPDGFWCVWSSIVEDFILENATEVELKEYFVECAVRTAEDSFARELARKKNGPKRIPFDKTYEEACKLRKEIHDT